ncbi:Folliculin-interacting protein 1 [Borealophlyctis nickersoniae]|nr:Folliculin-interacting protein 1 [Borealophlyctis nickersoniae]
MFTRLFRRQPAAAEHNSAQRQQPTPGDLRPPIPHSEPLTRPSFDADPRAANTPLDKSCLRILVCQDTGDKLKLPIFDTAYETSGIGEDAGWLQMAHGSGVGYGLRGGDGRRSQPLAVDRGSQNRHNSPSAVVEEEPGPGHGGRSRHRAMDSDGRYNLPGPQAQQGRRKQTNNLDLLGEMIFGAVPLASKGVTTKAHYFRTPQPQAMLSKLFTLSADLDEEDDEDVLAILIAQTERRARSASISSFQSTCSDAQSDVSDLPSRPPSRLGSSYSRSMQTGFGSYFPQSRSRPLSVVSMKDPALYGSSPTPSTISTLTDGGGSVHYRRRKAQKFNLNDIDEFAGSPGGSNVSSPVPSPANSIMKKPSRRKLTYAVAVVFDLSGRPQLRDFFFTHYVLIDRHLSRLQRRVAEIVIETLRGRSRSGRQAMPACSNEVLSSSALNWFSNAYAIQWDRVLIQEIESFRAAVCFLYDAPRIQEPVWLDMLTFPGKRRMYCQTLVSDLCSMLETYDTKQTNFFISTLISSVLAHHLAWTGTVASIINAKEGIEGGKPERHHGTPYNLYLGQLSDVYGSIGIPPKASRTVVISSQCTDFVKRLLRTLSYFVRCGEIVEHVQHMQRPAVHEEPPSSVSASNDTFAQEFVDFDELPLPKTVISRTIPDPNNSDDATLSASPHRMSYGRSMLAGWCPQYGPDFALMAVPTAPYMGHMKSDLQFSAETCHGSAAIILANVDEWQCRVAGYDESGDSRYRDDEPEVTMTGATASSLVTRMLHGLKGLSSCGLPAETCVTYLEDQLQELYNRSVMLSVAVAEDPSRSLDSLRATLGVEVSDMPLLISVASTFDDQISEQLYLSEMGSG